MGSEHLLGEPARDTPSNWRFSPVFRLHHVQDSANPRASAGRQITLDEIAVELAAMELRLRQIARAAEVPATPVEPEPLIDNLRTFSQADLDAIAHELNHRPRKVHGYRTPAEVYADILNSGDALTA